MYVFKTISEYFYDFYMKTVKTFMEIYATMTLITYT